MLIARLNFDGQAPRKDRECSASVYEITEIGMENDSRLMFLFAWNSPRGRCGTCGFSYDQLRFHGVLVVQFGTRAVDALQQDFCGGASHLA